MTLDTRGLGSTEPFEIRATAAWNSSVLPTEPSRATSVEGHFSVVEEVPGQLQTLGRVGGGKQDHPSRLPREPQRHFSRAPGARSDEHRIRAASAGPALHRGRRIFAGDVERAIRAETPRETQPRPVAVKDQDLGAPHLAQKQMQRSHGPRSQNRNRVFGLDSSALRRVDAAGQRLRQRCLLGRGMSGIPQQAPGWNADELCEAAADHRVSPAAHIVTPVARMAVSPHAGPKRSRSRIDPCPTPVMTKACILPFTGDIPASLSGPRTPPPPPLRRHREVWIPAKRVGSNPCRRNRVRRAAGHSGGFWRAVGDMAALRNPRVRRAHPPSCRASMDLAINGNLFLRLSRRCMKP